MIAAASDELGGFAGIVLALHPRSGVVMDRILNTGADQTQRSTSSPARHSSCAFGSEHRVGRNRESVTVDGEQLAG